MPIKLLHTSDVHLGAKLSYLGSKSAEQRGQIRKSFEKVVDTAIEQKVDVVMIAGDLFDNPYPSKVNVVFVRDLLLKLSKANIKVAVIAGNHDRLEPGSVFTSEEMTFDDPNIRIFHKDDNMWVIEEFDLTIVGVSCALQKSRKSPFSEIKESPKTKNNVALLHGSAEFAGREADNYPIAKAEIDNSLYNYIGLGDWHSMLELKKDKAYYSGSPELVDSDQKGAGNVLMIEISDAGTKVSSVKVGKREVMLQDLDLNKFKDVSSLKNAIEEKAGAEVVKLVTLSGLKSLSFKVDIAELEDSLSSKFFYLKISDKSNLQLTAEELAKYPEELLVGRFIKILSAKEGVDKEMMDDAIQYGVSLLTGVEK